MQNYTIKMIVNLLIRHLPIDSIRKREWVKACGKYRLNNKNGGFTPDKSLGSKAPRVEGPGGFIWRKADVRGI